jgi:hypothetical protein
VKLKSLDPETDARQHISPNPASVRSGRSPLFLSPVLRYHFAY